MDMPTIHECNRLTSENDQLRKKIKKLKRENGVLEKDLREIRDKIKLQEMMRQYVTTRDAQVQTDPPKHLFHGIYNPPKKVPEKTQSADYEKTNKLLTMHNSLMKRYEKELKTNMQHVETITTLNLKIHELEQKLKQAELKVKQNETDSSMSVRSRSRSFRRSRSKGSPRRLSASSLQTKFDQVKKERDRLVQDKKRLKNELKGLDHNFFDEIEDLKFALQQSAKLNKEYEKSLKKLCTKFGVPYPYPEAHLKTAW